MKERNYGIEFVCTGNGGRSPQAETIAKDYVRGKGGGSLVNIYSSGTGVEATANNLFEFPVDFLVKTIEFGYKSGTFNGKAIPIAKELVSNKEATVEAGANGNIEVRNKIKYCIAYLMADEVAKRNNVLLELGLVPEGHFHQQTVVRGDIDLILAMKKSNADAIKEIYKDERTRPEVVPICEYAGVEGEILDPFGGPIETYRETRDLIEEAVRRSLDKILEKEFHWSNNWVFNP